MRKFVMRDYQSEAGNAIFKEWEDVTSTLLVFPTGCGKTLVFSWVIDQALKKDDKKRALVIAHREELIWQARDKITRVTGLECGIEMGDLHVHNSLFGNTPVIISTIQTQGSGNGDRLRMGRFNPKDFSVLVIDEAHHATSPSYRALIHYYKFNNPQIKILGVTATPDRTDEEALGQVFDSVAFDYEILDAIHDGWLVPIDQQFVHIDGLDFSQVRTTAGDLNGADLAAIMESERNMQGVAGASIEIIGERRAIVFTASVKQAEAVSNILNRHRQGMSEWVCGSTNKDVRRDMLKRFQSGNIQVIANCGVLTEGFDDPGVAVIIMARPTKSRSLYAQIAGRGTRPLEGIVDPLPTPDERRAAIAASAKPSCLLVDFVGNSGRHKLMTSADILGGKVSDEAIVRAVANAHKKGAAGGAVRMSDELDQAAEEIRQEAEQRRLVEEARKTKLVANVRYSSKEVSPFDIFQISPVKERGWDNARVLSEKQRSVLLRRGINPDKLSYSQGKALITEMFRRFDKKLATLAQLKVLAKYGYSNPEITFDDASKTIDAIAKNGWRRK